MIRSRLNSYVLAAFLFAGVLLMNKPEYPDSFPDRPDSLSIDTAMLALDLDKAVEITIPDGNELKPLSFTTPDGRSGWGIRIPGGRPIATPAYADGMIFVGGGYGSHEFYAFDAATGELVWQIHTADDGPTAAVVEDGYVAFNTESCTVIVVEAKTGKLIWQEWLGDPLMSQPAIADGRLYIAYPKGGRLHGNAMQSAAYSTNQSAAYQKPLKLTTDDDDKDDYTDGSESHRMLCADLKTGRHIWDKPISADVISAPVIDSTKLYFTCFDGTSYCFDAVSGALLWKKENAGTSAPIIAEGQVVMTQKEMRGRKTLEGVKMMNREGDDAHVGIIAAGDAAYLTQDSGGGVAVGNVLQGVLDGSVGFSTAPAAANLSAANAHLGVRTVVGGWAYQGSRAAYKTGRIMNAQGRYLNSMHSSDGRMAWRAEARGKDIDANAQIFSPPAIGEEYLYLCTSYGHLGSVRQKDGAFGFLYRTSHPAAFQPALAEGNMYVGTVDGMLICLKTGSKDADGWYAWGGNARHNK